MQSDDAQSPASPGAKFEHFELVSVLGSGGFGVVWKAVDLKLNRSVALKLPRMPHVRPENLDNFLAEARSIAALRHPNVVPVYAIGTHKESTFIVMELIEGQNLCAHLKNKPLPPREAATIAHAITGAIDHAHRKGLVHRDLKPANILIGRDGTPFVVDFGLALRKDELASRRHEAAFAGTLRYMAPEQVAGAIEAIGPHTDVYAIGNVLYEMLSGRAPFGGQEASLEHRITQDAPPRLTTTNPLVPVELEAICERCLSKDPATRYPSAAFLREDLHRFLSGTTPLHVKLPQAVRLRNWFRRNRRTALAFCFVAVSSFLAVHLGRRSAIEHSDNRRRVTISTRPSGGKVTFAWIDPATGEPSGMFSDADTGDGAASVRLLPGDYLVVAELQSTGQWHEVIRHVPAPSETASNYLPHWRFKIVGDQVELPEINLPSLDCARTMLPINEGEAMSSNSSKSQAPSKQVQAFLVDQAVANNGAPMTYDAAVRLAEREGKRLPTLSEMRRVIDEVAGGAHPAHDGWLGQAISADIWTCSRPGGATVPVARAENAGWSRLTLSVSKDSPTSGKTMLRSESSSTTTKAMFVRSTQPGTLLKRSASQQRSSRLVTE